MTIEISIVRSDSEIAACFDAFKALQSHLKKEEFIPRVRREKKCQ